jgi:hypothetical protein
MIRWVGHVEQMGRKRYAHRVLVKEPEGFKCMWQNIIKMDPREIRCSEIDWIHLTLDRNSGRFL